MITMKHNLAYVEAKALRYRAKLDDPFPFYRNFIEMFTVLTKYLFDLGVQLTEFSVTVESVTLRFYCIKLRAFCASNISLSEPDMGRSTLVLVI